MNLNKFFGAAAPQQQNSMNSNGGYGAYQQASYQAQTVQQTVQPQAAPQPAAQQYGQPRFQQTAPQYQQSQYQATPQQAYQQPVQQAARPSYQQQTAQTRPAQQQTIQHQNGQPQSSQDNGPDMNKAIRIDGKGTIVELSLSGLNLVRKNAEGMLILSFVSYDQNNHRTGYLQNYLRFSEWYKMYDYVVLHKSEFIQDCANNIAAVGQQQGGYNQPKAVHTAYRGGTNRETGQLESRIFEIRPGKNTNVFGLCSSIAPGRRTQTGAVMPSGAPTSRVNVFVGYDDLAALLETGMQEIQAHKTALALQRLGGNAPVAHTVGSTSVNTKELEDKVDRLTNVVSALVEHQAQSADISPLMNEVLSIRDTVNQLRQYVE